MEYTTFDGGESEGEGEGEDAGSIGGASGGEAGLEQAVNMPQSRRTVNTRRMAHPPSGRSLIGRRAGAKVPMRKTAGHEGGGLSAL